MTSGASRKARAIFALLLALVCAAAGGGSARARGGESGPSKCASASDECEAARLAVRFVKRLQETGDAAPLVEEFFLPDFAERFQKHLPAGSLGDNYDLLFTAVSRKALVEADPADLRRAFVALLNLWHHDHEFILASFDVTEARHNLASVLGEDPDGRLADAVRREALSPAFQETCGGDPLLKLLSSALVAADDEADGDEGVGDSAREAEMTATLKAASIQNVARLRSFTEKAGRCATLLGEAVKKYGEELKAYPDRATERAIDLDDVYRVETATHDKEALGFPAGTPFLSARLFPYVVRMVRTEGGLKVVCVLPDFDGD
jgi:hypothetical protein